MVTIYRLLLNYYRKLVIDNIKKTLSQDSSICFNYRDYDFVVFHMDKAQEIGTQITLFVDKPSANTVPVDVNNGMLDSGNLSRVLVQSLNGQADTEPFGKQITYWQDDVERDMKNVMKICDRLSDIADIYPEIIKAGGKIIPILQEFTQRENNSLRLVVFQLMQDVAWRTIVKLKHRPVHLLLCPHCYTYFCEHAINISNIGIVKYNGCRVCSQSEEIEEISGQIVAVLDENLETKRIQSGDNIRINWLTHRRLIDFDEIEIIQATDEDIERFVVDVGNDTNERQKRKYETLVCKISSECEVSENTLRVLEHIFGKVERIN